MATSSWRNRNWRRGTSYWFISHFFSDTSDVLLLFVGCHCMRGWYVLLSRDTQQAFILSSLEHFFCMWLPQGCGHSFSEGVRLNLSLDNFGTTSWCRTLYSPGFEQRPADAYVMLSIESGSASIVAVQQYVWRIFLWWGRRVGAISLAMP